MWELGGPPVRNLQGVLYGVLESCAVVILGTGGLGGLVLGHRMSLQKELGFYMQSNLIDEFTEGTKSSYGVYEESNSVKLFVFGDSYADTGNYLNSPSYTTPYGRTFPGKPSGRFSDGRVLTDYVGNSRSITVSIFQAKTI
ncbi:GDSL esterase/lipase [Trifolium pratense]|uniref:GDSL esterase/lipase n=1 Tax=Trifolium pratense TaxID=57577 RepID=A0A2K3N2D0_TRIPR|nr:GDSL esterase/lipase [Trifolium pratense]